MPPRQISFLAPHSVGVSYLRFRTSVIRLRILFFIDLSRIVVNIAHQRGVIEFRRNSITRAIDYRFQLVSRYCARVLRHVYPTLLLSPAYNCWWQRLNGRATPHEGQTLVPITIGNWSSPMEGHQRIAEVNLVEWSLILKLTKLRDFLCRFGGSFTRFVS